MRGPRRHPLPIPADQGQWPDWARAKSVEISAPKRLVESHHHLAPAQRIAAIYPAAVEKGILLGFVCASAQGMRLPRGIAVPAGDPARQFARGAAAAVVLPPRCLFHRNPPNFIIGIYHAGIEKGLLLALEALPARKES